MKKSNLEKSIEKVLMEEKIRILNEGNPINNWWARARGHMSRWATFGRNFAEVFSDFQFSNYKLEAAWMRVKSRSQMLYNSLTDFEKDLESLYNEDVRDKLEDKIQKKEARGKVGPAERLEQRKQELDSFVEQLAQKAAELKGLIQDFKDARRNR